ncbi:hypothetical protein J6590_030743 [Homalodisca vitripennis]|nr:hypothetical protein J6590_030743 [Homalodisca vitripennis]
MRLQRGENWVTLWVKDSVRSDPTLTERRISTDHLALRLFWRRKGRRNKNHSLKTLPSLLLRCLCVYKYPTTTTLRTERNETSRGEGRGNGEKLHPPADERVRKYPPLASVSPGMAAGCVLNAGKQHNPSAPVPPRPTKKRNFPNNLTPTMVLSASEISTRLEPELR